MDLTSWEFVATIVASIAGGTGIAAAVNGVFAARLAKTVREQAIQDRHHAEEREREERYRQLREASREAHLQEVVDVIGLLLSKQAEHAEERKGFYVFHQPPAPDTVPDWTAAIIVLRRIALLHNDPEIRTRCQQTVESIESAWVEPVDEPDIDEIGQWIKWLRESAELMHKGAID